VPRRAFWFQDDLSCFCSTPLENYYVNWRSCAFHAGKRVFPIFYCLFAFFVPPRYRDFCISFGLFAEWTLWKLQGHKYRRVGMNVPGLEKRKVLSHISTNLFQLALAKFQLGRNWVSWRCTPLTVVWIIEWSPPRKLFVIVVEQFEAVELETIVKSRRLRNLWPVREKWVGLVEFSMT